MDSARGQSVLLQWELQLDSSVPSLWEGSLQIVLLSSGCAREVFKSHTAHSGRC